MMEQFDLDFGPEPKKPEGAAEPDPTSLTDDGLAALYKEKTGINPILRAFDRQTMLNGIAAGRDAEHARIKLIDDQENRDSIAATHIS